MSRKPLQDGSNNSNDVEPSKSITQ
jgi:hypothetical protein